MGGKGNDQSEEMEKVMVMSFPSSFTYLVPFTPSLATLNPYGTGVKRPRTKDEEGERLDREGLEEVEKVT